MRYFVLLMALVLSSCSHDDSQVNNGWVIYDLRPLQGGRVMYYAEDVSWVLKPMVENVPSGWNSLGCGGRKMYINIEGKGIVTSNNCWCQGDVSDAFKDLMPDNATWATKEEFDKAPVVGHIIEGIGLVFTDRGGHEVNA